MHVLHCLIVLDNQELTLFPVFNHFLIWCCFWCEIIQQNCSLLVHIHLCWQLVAYHA